jgi:hypothetical protein
LSRGGDKAVHEGDGGTKILRRVRYRTKELGGISKINRGACTFSYASWDASCSLRKKEMSKSHRRGTRHSMRSGCRRQRTKATNHREQTKVDVKQARIGTETEDTSKKQNLKENRCCVTRHRARDAGPRWRRQTQHRAEGAKIVSSTPSFLGNHHQCGTSPFASLVAAAS